MAAGDFKFFAQGIHDLGNKIHDLDGDTLKMALITTSTTPTVATSAPHYGGTGTTNMATNAVATGTAWTGPVTLGTKAWTAGSTGGTFDFADITVAQDASGFTNARWGIIYNDSDANKRCIGYLDLGSDRSIVGGSLTIQINASGALAIAQA